MYFTRFSAGTFLTAVIIALVACGGGGGGSAPSTNTSPASNLTLTGTAATGLAIPGAPVSGKCKVGAGSATTLDDGGYTLKIADGQLPCVLQITNPVDGNKIHSVAFGSGDTATANITPLTEMATARVLGSEPNVFFAAFDAAVATQKVTSGNIQTAQTDIGLVLAGAINTGSLGDFITSPLKAATPGNLSSGDAQDKLLDALKLKLTNTQIGTLTSALANNQKTDAIKQTVADMIGGSTSAPVAPVANAGSAQSVVSGSTVKLDATGSSAATGKSLTYAWTLTAKPVNSSATLTSPKTAKPTFVADVAGNYVASVFVNDGTSSSSAAAVTITASVANAAPIANAGVAQNVVAGSTVTLDGSASSDANGDSLTYAWTLTSKPTGSAAALSAATSAKPTFTADLAGTYIGTLTVNDGKVNSNAVTVSIGAVDPCANTLGNEASISYDWSLATQKVKLKNNNKCDSILIRATSAPIFTNSPNGVIDIRTTLAPGNTLDADAIVPAYLTWKPSVIYSLPNGKTYKFQPTQAGQSSDFTFEILLFDNSESYVGTIAQFATMFSIDATEDHYGACANFSWVDRQNGTFSIKPNTSMVSGECYVGNIQGVDSQGNGTYLPAIRYFVTKK